MPIPFTELIELGLLSTIGYPGGEWQGQAEHLLGMSAIASVRWQGTKENPWDPNGREVLCYGSLSLDTVTADGRRHQREFRIAVDDHLDVARIASVNAEETHYGHGYRDRLVEMPEDLRLALDEILHRSLDERWIDGQRNEIGHTEWEEVKRNTLFPEYRHGPDMDLD